MHDISVLFFLVHILVYEIQLCTKIGSGTQNNFAETRCFCSNYVCVLYVDRYNFFFPFVSR